MGDTFGDVERGNAQALVGPASVNASVPTAELRTVLQNEPEELALSRDVQETANAGTVTYNPSWAGTDVIAVETSTGDADSRAAIETAKELDYRSGHGVEIGLGIRVEQAPEEGVAEWGLGAEGRDSRAYYEEQADGTVNAVVEREGHKTRVPTSEWVDASLREVAADDGNTYFRVKGYQPFSATSSLGTDLDTAEGYIYQILYGWYGYSVILFRIVNLRENGIQEPTPCVGFVPTGNTSLVEINHPAFARVDNQGTAPSNETRLAVTGRQGSFWGDRGGNYSPVRHVITSPGTISSTAYTTLLLAQRKSSFVGVPADISRVEIVGGNTYDVEIRGRVTAATTPSWSDPSRDTEDPVPIEVDEGTDVGTADSELTGFPSGGGVVESGSQGNQAFAGGVEDKRISFVREEPAAIVAKDMTGSDSTPNAVVVEFASGI